MATCKSVLFVDAYDSFAQNITALLHQELGINVTSIKIDTNIRETFHTSLEDFVARYDAIVLGPGPGDPNNPHDVGMLYDLFDIAAPLKLPILGICLGFQALCIKYGLPIERMKEPCHGQPKKILLYHENTDVSYDHDMFDTIDTDNMWATCYNSLGLKLSSTLDRRIRSRSASSGTNASSSTATTQNSTTSQHDLSVLATDDEDNVMAVSHRTFPFWGVQFHPESCKSSDSCRQLVRNWWKAAPKFKLQNTSAYKLENNSTIQDHLIGEPKWPITITESGSSSVDSTLDAANMIASELLTATATTGNLVFWKKIHAIYSREQFADVIFESTRRSGIAAMLESTKKGRFSIYAVLDSSLLHPSTDPKNPNYTMPQVQYSQPSFSIHKSVNEESFRINASRDDVWTGLEVLMSQKQATGGPVDVPFWGGFMGCLSYEHGLASLQTESKGSIHESVPEISLVWVERSIIYDNHTNTVYVQSIRKNDHAFLSTMSAFLSIDEGYCARSKKQILSERNLLRSVLDTAEFKLPNHEKYEAQFHHCQNELRAGNSYELCLTTESTISVQKTHPRDPYEFELYKNLHAHNPVPFGAYIRLRDITILGTSPEQFMSWSRTGVVDMIPMKGTVKRSPSMTFERAASILASPKESAENLMIADLIRHDLYSAMGHTATVEVIKLCEVLEHETVYQLVSHIRAHSPNNNDTLTSSPNNTIHYGLKALRETMPPGSMTGAPKKRSCEILSHLEQRNRNIYSGVTGYMEVGGGGNWSVNIRTAFRRDDESVDRDIWHLGAGGAITVLSDAEGEWAEMMVKLESVLRGFKIVKG